MITARVWEENGAWEYDVTCDGPPAMRATGTCATRAAAAGAAAIELLRAGLYETRPGVLM